MTRAGGTTWLRTYLRDLVCASSTFLHFCTEPLTLVFPFSCPVSCQPASRRDDGTGEKIGAAPDQGDSPTPLSVVITDGLLPPARTVAPPGRVPQALTSPARGEVRCSVTSWGRPGESRCEREMVLSPRELVLSPRLPAPGTEVTRGLRVLDAPSRSPQGGGEAPREAEIVFSSIYFL